VREESTPHIEEFISRNDHHAYNASRGICHVKHQAHLGILNSSDSLNLLHLQLNSLVLTDESRLRPTWDQYFMELASLASQRSNCMKRRVGCVLIRDKRVISTGYNGTPRGLKNCNEGGCELSMDGEIPSQMLIVEKGKRCNDGAGAGWGLDTCLCIHAEENALLEAGRERIGKGSVLYCDTYCAPLL
jgi:dCMP deaminase